ncbi:MAG: enoyl-CoA hydratase [Acidobacteriota bacterium]|nr:enoyl-CoA hydratase [Acidobacteriota bacterium]
MSVKVEVREKGRIHHLSIDRPEKKNALTVAMYVSMAEAIENAEKDPSARVLLITGRGDSFTAGNDLKDFLEQPPRDMSHPVCRFISRLAATNVPIVAAVNGLAIGIGTTMLLHCDLVYASRAARFSLPFINLAVVPEAASTLLLPQVAGYRLAAELLMLGKPFDAETALRAGLINEICEPEKLLERAEEIARELAVKPAVALRQTKALLKLEKQPVADRIEAEISAFAVRVASPEAKEAFAAFMERRVPDFSKFD